MDEIKDLLKEDGYLAVNDCTDIHKIIFNPNLNVILIFTNTVILTLDVNSGVILQRVPIPDTSKGAIKGKYLAEHDKVLFWDGDNLGLRSDYNGVLLIDTILQPPITNTDHVVKIEMLLSEAILLHQSLLLLEQQGVENSADVINELVQQINEAQQRSKKGIKAQKWETICLELPHSSLKVVSSTMVMELKTLQRHIPALAIASAINERLTDLIINGRVIENDQIQRFNMYSEAARRKTFDTWPHLDYKWALPDQMAQAGFYHQSSESGDDRAMCFTCSVCLVCWEKTDEPWSEHERHSGDCPFLKGEYTQNVPLSVTHATSPASSTGGFDIISSGDSGSITCVGNVETGDIMVWNVERQLKLSVKFNIKSCEKGILKKNDVEDNLNTKLTALCSFKKQTVFKVRESGAVKTKLGVNGTRIIAGVKCKWSNDDLEKQQAFETEKKVNSTKEFLIVYAVTEPPKLSAKPNATTANGTASSEEVTNPYSNMKNGSSSLLTILESSHEDCGRIDGFDDFLKFIDHKETTKQGANESSLVPSNSSSVNNNDKWMFTQAEKSEATELDSAKSVTMNGPSTGGVETSVANKAVVNKSKTENEMICFPIQTIQIPTYLFDDYEITEILPSFDNRYLLIVLKRSQEKSDDEIVFMETDQNDAYSPEVFPFVHLLLYGIDDNGLIKDLPLCQRLLGPKDTPIEISMLPKFDTNGRLFSGSPTESGAFVMTCVDGSIKVISITSLKTLSEAKVEGQKFISTVYCKNLERLCGCTDKGLLHFYSFYDLDVDSSDEVDEESVTISSNSSGESKHFKYDSAVPSTSTATTSNIADDKRDLIAHQPKLTLKCLKTLYSLTLFDEMLTPYSAEVPGCWTELVQAQKQRRHPQHLSPGEDTHLTRTWRLHNDATTWDEHLIELSLPKTTSLGHIDFKFGILQPCSNPPAIQVTLLKQKSIGLCCRRKQGGKNATSSETFDVDDNINFNLNSSSSSSSTFSAVENPVLNEEYLQARNAEILVGPIELASCMDLNEQGGTVALVSPKLLKSKARNYLLHIKTMADVSKDGHSKMRVPVRKKGITSVLLSSFANKDNSKVERVTFDDINPVKSKASNQFYIGCDWLHEISITVRATREVPNITNERLQRSAMLESNTLLKNLLVIAKDNNQPLPQSLALDILTWILSIRLARYRCPRNYASTEFNHQQSLCVNIVEQHLNELISKCILMNNRSTARKCVKLVIATMHGAQNIVDQKQCFNFEITVRNSVLTLIPDLIKTTHAGAVRWFTMLISATSNIESQESIAIALMKLLVDVLKEISVRPNAMNSILQSRFGLYGMPFESELFDAELPSIGKNSMIPYSNVFTSKGGATTVINNGQQQNQFSDLKNFCASDGTDIRIPTQLRRKGVSNHIRGLLEVEPLHFVCCSTSEATRVENIDSLSMQATNIIDDIVIETPPQFGASKVVGNSNFMKLPNDKATTNNETEMEKMESSAKNLVDKIFYSQIKKHKFKDIKSTQVSDSSSEMPMFTGDEELMIMNDAKNAAIDIEMGRNSAGSAMYNNKVKEFIEEINKEDSVNPIMPWHRLLGTPAKQMVVVDRMHSGARRQVTLDFGYPILLTDVVMPACSDLASITIDLWCFDEDEDLVRLAVSQDIGVKALILSDLQPAPVCRYMKITFMGRYGMSATRCKLPMGSFYGHIVILEQDAYADPVMKFVKVKKSYIKTQLQVLNALYEDTHCRYCLSSSKLSEILQPFLKSDSSNMSHMQSYLNRIKETEEPSPEFSKILSVYEECIAFQNQLNIVRNVIKRLENNLNEDQSLQPLENGLKSLCTDKLRVMSECLADSLLHFITSYGSNSSSKLHNFFDLDTCNLMFKTLVINGDSHIRLTTCSLLVRMCSYTFKPWWGDFFSNTFTSLFSSQNVEIFPQDRVFILLTYLGKRSIYHGACRTIVIDAVLKTIANLLAPLSTFESHVGVWRSTDLVLLSWMLLFLSVCLDDNNEKKENSSPRWDFMSGDMVKARLSLSNGNSRSFSRSFKKRFMQSKQNNTSQNIAEKVYMMSEQFANTPSLTGGNIDAVLKSQESAMKKLLPLSDYLFNKSLLKKTSSESTSTPSVAGSTSSTSLSNVMKTEFQSESTENISDKGLKAIKQQNMLVVIRGLIGLLLNMDFTCNMDLFLLTCKIIARLVNVCKMSVQLCSIITTQQLLQLSRIAVWENQQHPWAVHAITCLLQDILEADRSYKVSNQSDESDQMDVDGVMDRDMDLIESMDMAHGFAGTSGQSASQIKVYMNYDVFKNEATKYQLPSLMECDDTDGIEDILDDILEQSKKLTAAGIGKKDGIPPTPPARNGAYNVLYRSKVSATMDARLEYGLDTNIETFLRRLTIKSSLNLSSTVAQQENKDNSNVQYDIPAWPETTIGAWNDASYQQQIDTNIMLMEVFETIFSDLHLEDSWLNLEQVLQLWLTLNGDITDSHKFVTSSGQSKIPFGEKAVYGLLKALASHPNLKIRGWCLGFQCLIYSISSRPRADSEQEMQSTFGSTNESYSKKIGQQMLQNENFEKMLLRFFSGIYKNNSLQTSRYAGPTICRLMLDLFACLQNKCQAKEKLKAILLRVVLNLIQRDGAICKQYGPIDAQSQLVRELLNYQYQKSDLCIAMSIIESVSNLVYQQITNVEKIQCQKSSDTNSNSNNVFGSLFATVLGSESAQSKTVTDTTILMNLLKLSTILIRTKIPPLIEDDAMRSGVSQSDTDEKKAQQQQLQAPATPSRPTPTFTDTVLQHFPSMNKFLGALSHCTTSSAALLAICSVYSPINNDSKNSFSDPQNIEDALFQLLSFMNKLASEPVLIIKPLFDYLNYVSNIRHAMPKIQLSEPFLWFVLKILETSPALEVFCEMGGVKILAENLVKSNRTMLNMQPNLVTMIMQHLSKSQNLQSVATQTVKKTSSSSLKHEEGLVNFGPYCTITSENPSAQPADVLIQGPIASHRRARAPAWSYLFYPNESHVDLTMTMPTAVLLKEIQLQPHLSTLASCPSAVAIEITRDGNFSPIPITQPISTTGMTCIRLRFSQPEIATQVVIRLYRPKDSASIGLTQISVLGTTIFSDTGNVKSSGSSSSSSSDLSGDEDSFSETSFGWLRILAQCFNVASFNPDNNLSNMVISSASEVKGFLEACCSLLTIAPSMTNFLLQNLETVLLKLGLNSRELSLNLIGILLNESVPQIFKLCNESVSDLLYQLCTTSDSFARDRIQVMITWLTTLQKSEHRNNVNPNSGYIKCLASILWRSYATNLVLDLGNMITPELFESLYNWLQDIQEETPMKASIDSMMCSICCIRPEFFNLLLRKMSILVPKETESTSISDDRKDNESMTDDSKQHEYNTEEWYCHYIIQSLSKLTISTSQLRTIAMACQSPLAIYQLIDSGLPNLFTSAILEFCHRMSNRDGQATNSESMTDADKAGSCPMVNVLKITEILDFMAEICSEGYMRDWLGSYEGSVFWEPLLTLLCNNKLQSSTFSDEKTNQPYLELEETVIKFLSNVTSCHPKNQDTLTTNLISVIRTTERNNYNINHQSPVSMKYSISGFTRRLVLQILLESEKIVVSVRSELPLQRKCESNIVYISNHPSKMPNSHHLLFYLSINSKCQEILENSISPFNNLLQSLSSSRDLSSGDGRSATSDFPPPNDGRAEKRDLWDLGMQMNFGMEFLSVAAGVTAKDKRLKELKNQENAQRTKDLFNVLKMKPDDVKGMSNVPGCVQLVHSTCSDATITSDTTIGQILTMLKSLEISLSTPCICLNLVQTKKSDDDSQCDNSVKASDFNPLPSPLQIFSSRGGLSLLAYYLPTVYPDQPKTAQKLGEKDKNLQGEWVKGEWIKIEPNEEIYEDIDDSLLESSSKMPVISSVPQHSLAAFGLFLKLPAYSEVLLRDKVRAQCLLRLILGVTGDGEGNDIYSLSLSSSLPTLPFEVLRQLLDCSPLTTDDGVLLRRMIVEVGAIHLVLNCLSIFTHHNSNIAPSPEMSKPVVPKTPASATDEPVISDDKSHVYWAKGTGFGTGSTQQSWNVEQALLRQKSEEEHVTVLLQVISSYINPGDVVPTAETFDIESNNYEDSGEICDLPPLFIDLLLKSCLIPALCSYLRNDSVLDITRHIPLYRAILQLLRAISISSQLIQLLIAKHDNTSKTSIASLLYNMKSCVDTYASRLKFNKKSNLKGQMQKISISLDESDDEGLALLIPDIQETAALVQSATYADSNTREEFEQSISNIDSSLGNSIEQKYLEVMKKLQFDTFEMIVESENGYRFTISHHFESNVRMSGDRGHPARVKRLAQETVTLSTSLPLSFSSSVFVRCDTDRLDIMKVLITGPADTPYANGCFEFDVYFPHDYPNSPMMINLETTGRHSVRFNPNLYNDGKVCLSVLNTWHGRPEEKWNAQTSSFLQVLVSIQSLILVSEPYFNEPGFERSRGTPSGNHSSREYNSNIYQASVKWGMIEQLRNPCPCFKDVIYTHFWLKRNEICQQIENWIAELSRPLYSERSGRAISFNSMVLRRQYRQIREELSKLPVPEGLEDFDNPFSANAPSSSPANVPTTSASASRPSTAIGQTYKDKMLMEIFNSIEDKDSVAAIDGESEKSNNLEVIDDLLNFSDTSLDLLDKATKTMKDIEKMLTEDMGSD